MAAIHTPDAILKIKPCIFCNYTKPQINIKIAPNPHFTRKTQEYTAQVRCPRCHSRGPTAHIAVPLSNEPTEQIAPKEVRAEAVEKWNLAHATFN